MGLKQGAPTCYDALARTLMFIPLRNYIMVTSLFSDNIAHIYFSLCASV